MFRHSKILMALVFVALACSGCATKRATHSGGGSALVSGMAVANMTEVRVDRMLVWKAQLSLQVWSVSNAVTEATTMAKQQGGFVEQKSDRGDESANMTLRIPAKTLRTAMANLETLGDVTYRSVEGEDVTEQYIDVDARLKNKIVLRERLKQLLDKATTVKDILAIETELNRLQGDIDSMEGRIKSLKGLVDFATITLSLERKPILGPLGYLCKGVWWCVEKLFVIRE